MPTPGSIYVACEPAQGEARPTMAARGGLAPRQLANAPMATALGAGERSNIGLPGFAVRTCSQSRFKLS
jgi:hypothetical protein